MIHSLSLLASGQQFFQLLLVIFVEIVEIVDLVIVSLLLALGQLSVLTHDLLDFLLKCLNVLIMLLAGGLQITDVLLHLIFALLSHESFAHAIGDRALIESLVGLDGHLDLITHTHEQETALSAVNGDLADELIEALGEELFAEGADACLASLRALKLLIELILQIDHIDLSGGLGRNVTHPEASYFSEFSWRQDRV